MEKKTRLRSFLKTIDTVSRESYITLGIGRIPGIVSLDVVVCLYMIPAGLISSEVSYKVYSLSLTTRPAHIVFVTGPKRQPFDASSHREQAVSVVPTYSQA